VLSTLSDIANNEEEHISFMEKKQWWDVEDSEVYRLDESGDIGLDVAERVFFETYINRQDISIEGTEYENGRPSRAAFQDMNFECTRKYSGSGPRVVVLQTCEKEALRPQSIVVAYKENGFVTPVVSDFDCFTLGTRGVAFESPLPKDQVELLKWLIQKIVTILDSPQTDKSWTSCWLDVLKDSASKGFTPKIPAYGFGDSKSYAIMEGAVSRFQHNKNGAIRHGSESFNYYFPQELDDQFLVISDCLPGNIPWKYVDAEELKKLLCEKIDEGFCFPLNPKWILADQGWKKVYDQMMGSTCENTQTSLNSWYPKDSGIRELIESVHERFPNGFQRLVSDDVESVHERFPNGFQRLVSDADNDDQSTTRMNRDDVAQYQFGRHSFSLAQSHASSNQQLKKVTIAIRSKSANRSSRGRSIHDTLYELSLVQQDAGRKRRHEVESSLQRRAAERTGKLTTSHTDSDHLSLQKKRQNEKRESLKEAFANSTRRFPTTTTTTATTATKRQQKITINQAGRLYDRLMMHKNRIEEKKLQMRKDREAREMSLIQSNSQRKISPEQANRLYYRVTTATSCSRSRPKSRSR
jgi:hypothetical protein